MPQIATLPKLSAGNVILEPTNSSHAEALLALVDQNRQHLRQWLPWVDFMKTVADFEAYLNRCEQQHKAGTDYSFVIKVGETITGRIGIHYIDQRNQFGAIGYWIGEGFSGQGVVTNACKRLIQFCFEEVCLNRIEIKCATGNHRSSAVAERLGFLKEGILRQAELVNGEFLDLNLYSLLKSDWQPSADHHNAVNNP